MPPSEKTLSDWIHLLPQFGPRHVWGNARAIVTGIAHNRSVGHPLVRTLMGIENAPTEVDRVVHRGSVSTRRSKILFNTLATLVLPFYYLFAVLGTIAMEVSVRLTGTNVVEPKERAMRRELRKAIKAGKEARERHLSDSHVMNEQLKATKPATLHAVFRRVCAPSTVASEREQVTRDAIATAHDAHKDANKPRSGGISGLGE
jgi:hypothetical protein